MESGAKWLHGVFWGSGDAHIFTDYKPGKRHEDEENLETDSSKLQGQFLPL